MNDIPKMTKALLPFLGKVDSLFMPACSSNRVLSDITEALSVPRKKAGAHFLYPDSVQLAHGWQWADWRERNQPWPGCDVLCITKHAQGMISAEPLIDKGMNALRDSKANRVAALLPMRDLQRFRSESVSCLLPDLYLLADSEFCWAVYQIRSCYPQMPGKWRTLQWRT